MDMIWQIIYYGAIYLNKIEIFWLESIIYHHLLVSITSFDAATVFTQKKVIFIPPQWLTLLVLNFYDKQQLTTH
ncbi:hypothetical protein DERP_001451 [Dermatophagoides pteronyssinus]|uniref:TLC domain-containing protein n=1 Tax=Dermatophagoides pteronyssinus TaxID=6956 RepID=A0ABQ8JEI4_DERPT|nr:hypothetical protein DERP_001451 [Dermatophagoides pteronyssinus]